MWVSLCPTNEKSQGKPNEWNSLISIAGLSLILPYLLLTIALRTFLLCENNGSDGGEESCTINKTQFARMWTCPTWHASSHNSRWKREGIPVAPAYLKSRTNQRRLDLKPVSEHHQGNGQKHPGCWVLPSRSRAPSDSESKAKASLANGTTI